MGLSARHTSSNQQRANNDEAAVTDSKTLFDLMVRKERLGVTKAVITPAVKNSSSKNNSKDNGRYEDPKPSIPWTLPATNNPRSSLVMTTTTTTIMRIGRTIMAQILPTSPT